MATLSAYPLNRGKGTRGKVVLRLREHEVTKLLDAKGDEFFKTQRFVLRGTLRPFRCELLADKNGTSFFNHGAGRMQLNVRCEDLTPLDPGADLKIENLTVRTDQGLWIMATSDTKFGTTKQQVKRQAKEPARGVAVRTQEVGVRPLAVPLSPTPAVATASPIDAAMFDAELAKFASAFNRMLDEYCGELLKVEIENGRIAGLTANLQRIVTI